MTPIRYALLLVCCLLWGARPMQAQCNLQLNTQTTHVQCFGESNGSISVTASNGTEPYQYIWSNGQFSQTAQGLGAGTYTVTVSDEMLCTKTASVSVQEPALLIVEVPDLMITCFAPNTVLAASVMGGVGPYQYQWSNGETGSSTQVSAPGSYTVTVTDANACIAIGTGNVLADLTIPVACILTPDVLTCATTQITLDAGCTPNFPQFSYQWTTANGNIVSGANTRNPVVDEAGIYTILVADTQNGCSSQASVAVTESTNSPIANAGPSLTLTCVIASQTLNGGNSSAGPNFTYQWSGPGIVSGQNSLFPTVDAPGMYTLSVTDTNNGCTDTDQVLINEDLSLPPANAGPDLGLPCGGGTVILQADPPNGGVINAQWFGPGINASNQFLWNPVVDQAGTYTLVAVNSTNGCTATDVVTVFPGPAIPLNNFTVTDASCAGSNGAVELDFSDAPAPYTYLWSNGATTEDLANLPAGNYTLVLTDANDCKHYADITIKNTPPISVALVQAGGSPCGESIGFINIMVTGGAPPYNYLWSNGAVTNNLSNISSGVYTVTVTDTGNCEASLSAVVSSSLGLSTNINHVLCFGASTGSIDASVINGIAPFNFNWAGPNNFSATTANISSLEAGNYLVTVTDAASCVGVFTVLVNQPAQPNYQVTVNQVSCHGAADGLAVATISNAPQPVNYIWSNGSTTQTIAGLPAGIYTVTITDGFGCSIEASTIVSEPPVIEIHFITLSNLCGTAVVAPVISGGQPQGSYFFNWSTGAHDSLMLVPSGTSVTLTVTDATGCTSSAIYDAPSAGSSCSMLRGRVYRDLIENCLPDGEPGIGGWIMRAEGPAGTFYGVTQADGSYTIGVEPGDYNVLISPPNPLWIPCWVSLPAGAVGLSDTIKDLDFPVAYFMLCPELFVDITSGNLRPCFNNNFFSVYYCNQGPGVAEDPFIIVDLGSQMSVVTASIPYTDLGNGKLQFDLQDLSSGECHSFSIIAKVACNVQVGQTLCAEAHIYPDTSCTNSPLWSGASLRISSQCDPDSVRFRIENIGIGNMPNALDYIVIEDQVMIMSAPVQLDAGQFTMVSAPANGSTWRLEVEQEPFHPGQSSPSVSVEGCTTGAIFSTGFVNQFPQNDADDFVDIHCQQTTGSYDPNDKQGYPVGYGAEHYVRPGTPLEYLIRFQNTGTDTAFTVRLVDTLSAWLDPTTLRPGASSHSYTWDLNGQGVLRFLFENILLPDSNVNEAASHGFVKFGILPRADAPLETQVENKAEIYFDFNAPIVTNTTFHRLGQNFVLLGLWTPRQPEYAVSVTPNPFSETAILEINGLKHSNNLRLRVTNLQGQNVLEAESDNGIFQLKRGNLPPGLYLFNIEQSGKLVGSGKLVAR